MLKPGGPPQRPHLPSAHAKSLVMVRALLSNPHTKAFASPQRPQERKEALPLPLGVRAAWERKVCENDCPPGLCIVLGAFLLATRNSVRFGDIQRINVVPLSLTARALCVVRAGLRKPQNSGNHSHAPSTDSQEETHIRRGWCNG